MTALYVVAWLFAIALGPVAVIASDKRRFSQRTQNAVRAGAVLWSAAAMLIPIGGMVRCLLRSVAGP